MNPAPDTLPDGHESRTASLTAAGRSNGLHTNRLRNGLALLLAMLLIAATAFYAFIAMETSRTMFHHMSDPQSVAKLEQIRAAADAGVDVRGSEEVQQYSPLWFQWMSEVTDSRFSYGSDSLQITEIYYARMPTSHQWVLGLHMALGGLCMLLGGLQFWPGFRRKYPRWHRRSGMVFVGAAQLAMIMSITYLSLTGVANTYAQLTFHVGLWFLAIVVTLALWLSVYHVKNKQIAQHLGWMALVYGLLISAPLTRYDWVAIGMLFPQVSFNEANYSMMAVLIVQCFLVGYALIGFNRWQSRARPTLQPMPWADSVRDALPRWLPLFSLTMLAVAATTIWHYLIAPGPAHSATALRMIPAGVIANESRVLEPQLMLRTLYAALTVGVLVLAPFFLRRAFAQAPTTQALPASLRNTGRALALIATLAALIQCWWGYALGGPSHATLAGGTFYMLTGSVELLFALLLALNMYKQRLALIKETGVFVIIAATVAPLFYWMLSLLDLIGIPAQYIATGHGYGLAIGLAPIGLLGGFVYAIYGSASRERAVY